MVCLLGGAERRIPEFLPHCDIISFAPNHFVQRIQLEIRKLINIPDDERLVTEMKQSRQDIEGNPKRNRRNVVLCFPADSHNFVLGCTSGV